MKKLLIVFFVLAASGYAQTCSGYTKRYDITIQPGQVAGTLTDYTMLVSGTYPYLAVGGAGFATNTSGYDITFFQGIARLAWNMPIYDSTTGRIKANVRIPSATTGAMVSMCVGNPSITTFLGGTNAYDAFTKIALQFSAAGIGLDSTGQNPPLTNDTTARVTTGPTALIDAASFAGSQSLVGGPGTFPTGNSSRTVSYWMNTPALQDSVALGYGSNTGGSDNAFVVRTSPPAYPRTYGGQWTWIGNSATAPIVVNEWHRWDITFYSPTATCTIYLDSVYAGSTGGVTVNTTLSSIALGRLITGGVSGLFPYTGQLAEVRISSVDRSGNWMTAEYRNQSNPAAFYSITAGTIAPPSISAVSITANSPFTVKASWTTDAPMDSQVACATMSGGPYSLRSDVVNPNPTWNVTAHSMSSNPLPGGVGPYYCIVISTDPTLAISSSVEQPPVTLPARLASTPIALVGKGAFTRFLDRQYGVNGAPATGDFEKGDGDYFCWADDNNEYLMSTQFGNPPANIGFTNALGVAWITMFDDRHTIGARIGSDWQNSVTNMGSNGEWFAESCISINGSLYTHVVTATMAGGNLYRSTNHFKSTISPQSNVGPDTTYITNMQCSAGTVTATAKLAGNMTAQRSLVILPGKTAIFVEGASGTNVNGVHEVTANTSTTISWAQSCTTPAWSWNATGGTGSGGGVISTYGWDYPTALNERILMSWVQTDAGDYQLGSKQAGMDAFVYFWINISGGGWAKLCRNRLENFPLQNYSGASCYVGHQNGDDGLFDSNWDYSTNKWNSATQMNQNMISLFQGKGAGYIQSLYVTAFNRYLYSHEVSIYTDSDSGGTTIYEGGPYPWSPVTIIGDGRRNPDKYSGGGPEFPEFVAKSQSHSNGVTSINLANSGNNAGDYTLNMSPDYQFAARGSTVAKAGVAGEVTDGMDLAYNFDVFSGALSMPNDAPSDAKQKWAWNRTTGYPMSIDNYGSFEFSMTSTAAVESMPTHDIFNVGIPTPYRQALPGALTVVDCFGHYPTTLLSLPAPGAIALQKGTDLTITWTGAKLGAVTLTGGVVTAIAVAFGGSGYTVPPIISILGDYRGGAGATAIANLTNGAVTSVTITNGGSGYTNLSLSIPPLSEPTNNWAVSFLGTNVGSVSIPDNSIGCVVVRRDSNNRVNLYTSAGIGKSLPLTVSATAAVSGAWSSSPIVFGDNTNAFWGIESLLRVWSRDVSDDELISEMAAIRRVLWARGKGSAIP